MPINNLIQFRKGTDWSSNPTLSSGEPGFDIANNVLKIGDGVSTWSNLVPVNTKLNNFNIYGTGNINISGIITANSGNFDVVSFNVDDESILTKGQISWDDTEGTLSIGLNGAGHHMAVGESRFFRVRNTTGSDLYKGQVVYATGVNSNGLISPDKFIANGTIDEIRFIGVVFYDISDNNNGYVVDFGHVRDLDLDGSVSNYAVGDETWLAGDILYAHPTAAGKLTKVEPKDAISIAIILDPGNGNGNGKMFVRPNNFGHLSDNHDVDTSGLLNNQFLVYDSVSDYWQPSSGLYYVDGDLGIGTASPQAKLDVNGTVQFDDLVRWEYPDKILDTNIGTLGYLRPYDEAGAYCGLGVSASSFNIGTSGAINTRFIGQGVERAIFDTNGNFIFNDNGNNCDFRIEGDTDQNLFFCDASSDNIGIGTNSPNSQSKLQIYNTNSNYVYQQLLAGNNFGTMTLMSASVNQTINTINGVYSFMFPTTNGSVAGFYHFRVDPPSGLGSMITQVGYLVGPGMKYATNNFAYRGQLPDGPNNNWNLYNDGSAPNYMAGSFGVGTTTLPYKLNVNGDIGLTDSGFYASPTGVMVGTSGWLYNDGQTTLSHGNFSNNGDAQNSSYVLRTSTTNDTFTTIQNNASNVILASNRTMMFTANIVARRTNGQDNAAYKIEGVLVNDGYGASILGTPIKTILYESDSSWDVQAILSGGGAGASDYLLIQGKGAASKNVNWVCKLDLLEVGGDISGYTEVNILNVKDHTIP